MVNKMKLYIIGNGFDIYHGLNTRYSSFGLYLKKNYREVYDLLLEHYGFTDLDPKNSSSISDPLWSEFEANMAALNIESVLEVHSDLMPNIASDDFRDRDRYTFSTEMEKILNQLTTDLYQAFKEFILAVDFSDLSKDKIINLDKDATYITFNYTDTLAKYYKISNDNVLFIHEKAENDDQNLILGHGIDPDNFKDKPIEPPIGLNEEELEDWNNYQAEKYDYSFELGKQTINEYFSRTFKCTEKIIEKYKDFFLNLSNVSEVYILGHSLAEVDLPYFDKLVKSVKPDARWTVTFYSPEEERHHFEFLKGFGISNISIVTMQEI